MGLILGVIRYILVALVIVFGALGVVIVEMTNWQPQGIPAAQWVATYMARSFNVIFRVRLTVTEPEKIRNFPGFIVANHVTYLDIVSLMAFQPVRMLSAAEVTDTTDYRSRRGRFRRHLRGSQQPAIAP